MRICNIRYGDDDFSPLEIVLGNATCLDEDDFEAVAALKCTYFNRKLTATGHDGAQALLSLPLIIHGYLQGLASKGYSIFWLEPGDLDHSDFWGVRSLTSER